MVCRLPPFPRILWLILSPPPDIKVTGLSYTKSEHITVEEIHITEAGTTGIIHVHDPDVVLITLGSMTSYSTLGTNTIAAPSVAPSDDGSWALWDSLSHDSPYSATPPTSALASQNRTESRSR